MVNTAKRAQRIRLRAHVAWSGSAGDASSCGGALRGARSSARRHGLDLPCRTGAARRGLPSGRVRRAPSVDRCRSAAADPTVGVGGALRVPSGGQPPPRRVPVLRRDRRRGLRSRHHTVPDCVGGPRLRDRRGRGDVLGSVSRVSRRRRSAFETTAATERPTIGANSEIGEGLTCLSTARARTR
jgi:hypothetical protein